MSCPGPLCSSATSAAPLVAQTVSPNYAVRTQGDRGAEDCKLRGHLGKVEIDDEDEEGGDPYNGKFSLMHTLLSNTCLPQVWHAIRSCGLNDWGKSTLLRIRSIVKLRCDD